MLQHFVGVYIPRAHNVCTPRVSVFSEECQCLLMDIFCWSDIDMQIHRMAVDLIALHDKILAMAVNSGTPMISAVHSLVAAYNTSINTEYKLDRVYSKYSIQIETALVAASSVVLLDLSAYISPSPWLKRSIKFMRRHDIDFIPVTPRELNIDAHDMPGTFVTKKKDVEHAKTS